MAGAVLLQRTVVEPEPRQVRAHLRRGRAGLLYICLQRHHLVKHLPFTSAVATAEALEEHDVVLYTAKKEFDAKRGPNFKYETILGTQKPQLDYRKGTTN